MTTYLELALGLRRLFCRDDEARGLAIAAASDAERENAERARIDAPVRTMKERGSASDGSICLGSSLSSEGRSYSVRLPEKDVRGGGHWLVTGATGSGKSYLVLGIILQLLRSRPSGLVIIDMKGELAGLLRDVLIPGLIGGSDSPESAPLLRQLAVIAPFDDATTIPFQLLAREPRLPIEVQAHEVATTFGRTVASDLGPLQQHLFRHALMLAIDVGLTLPDVAELLRDQTLLRGALERTSLEETKRYFAAQFGKERGTSVAGLLSRLDSITMYPSLRRMLRAPGMVRFDRMLETAITIVDLGGAPAGMSELSRFFGQLIFNKLTRAIFARRVEQNTPPVAIIADEFQQLLTSEVARDFERILTLARSQRVFLWSIFQQAAQVEAVSSTLLRILRTNTNYQLLMRSDLEDARTLAHVLPTTGTAQRSREGFPDPRTAPTTMTVDEERRKLLEMVPSMPDRVGWFWERRAPHPALLLRSARLDVERGRQAANRLSPELRTLIRSGVLAIPADELERAERNHRALRESLVARTNSNATAEATVAPSIEENPLADEQESVPRSSRSPRPRRGNRRPSLG